MHKIHPDKIPPWIGEDWEVLPLVEEIPVVDACWEGLDFFQVCKLWRTWGDPYSSGWFYMCAYTGIIKWTQWQMGQELGTEKLWGVWEGFREWTQWGKVSNVGRESCLWLWKDLRIDKRELRRWTWSKLICIYEIINQ